ncbi:MAG TPA: hypothetical protein VI818_03090 [Candidatus Thermoplasmatota archaeon]|nr:hypothetical protein [Candidatus Thermoplasmatota archaeon]
MRVAPALPPDWQDVVRKHWRDTPGYVVAASGACLDVQAQETVGERGQVPGRQFQAHRPGALRGFRPTGSWFMGILLCPGDDVLGILEWTSGLSSADAERVVFYVHPRFDRVAMAAWHASTRPRVVRFGGTWRAFHRLYGRHHADRVYQDHRVSS